MAMFSVFAVFLGLFLFVGSLMGLLGYLKIGQLENELRQLRLSQPLPSSPSTKQPSRQAATSPAPPAQSDLVEPREQLKAKPSLSQIPPTSKSNPGFVAKVEQSLRGNWLIWIAGLALAFGGVFLVQYAAEAGLLGAKARIVLALIAGAAMVGFAHFLRTGSANIKAPVHSFAPAILAGAGLITLYGAVYASFALYGLIAAGLAFGLLALIAAFALYQALLFGPVIAVFALIGAFIAPILIGSDDPSAIFLFSYVFLVSASGLALARMRPWRWNSIIALAGGLGWPLLWLLQGSALEQIWVLQVYLPALVATSLALAWGQAKHGLVLKGPQRSSMALFTTLAAIIGSGLLAIWIVVLSDHDLPSMLSLAGLGVLSLFASWRREGFSPNVAVMAILSALALAIWPQSRAVLIDAPEELVRFLSGLDRLVDGPTFLSVSFGFTVLFGIGGYLASLAQKQRAILISIAALFPSLVLFIAYWRITGLNTAWPFAAAALAITLSIWAILERESKVDPGFVRHPGVGAALALGISGSALLVFLMLFSQMWLSLALSGQALFTALFWRRFNLSALKLSAMALAFCASFRLIFMGEAFDMEIGTFPIFNGLLLGFGGSSLFLAAAAFVFVSGKQRPKDRVVQSLYFSALAVLIAMLSLQIRHLMTNGDLSASIGFAEIGLQISLFAALAALLRWRLGPKLNFTPKWGERILIALSLFGFLVLAVWWQNPWWGMEPATISLKGLWFNPLKLVYLLPAILFAIHGIIFRKQGQAQMAKMQTMFAALAGFLWITLEIRLGFHGAEMAIGGIVDSENYVYSASWLLLSVLALSIGFWRQLAALRIGGLILLAITSVKIFVFDLAALDGLLRGISFLGLGASLMGIGLLYQKLAERITPPSNPKLK